MASFNSEIALLRHGKPKALSSAPISACQFSEWISRYDDSGIAENSAPAKANLEYANKCDVLVCSSLPRSIQSAELLSSDQPLVSDKLFCEAGMPCAQRKTLKLPPKVWAVLFRVFWYFGYSRNSESYSDARKRASMAAHKLVALAEEHRSVMLVGHGIINRLIARELKSLGWSGPANPGSLYWDYRIYTK